MSIPPSPGPPDRGRDERLQAWLDGVLAGVQYTLEPASADASFRRYLRVRAPGAPSRILMDSPPEHYALAPFLDIGRRLAHAGVRVPRVLAADPALGAALLEDLGSTHYLDRLAPERVEALYDAALDALIRMQLRADPGGLPEYDEALLRREAALFEDWLLGRHLGLALAPGQRGVLAEATDRLVAAALEQPRVFVHRDYHARNLMVVTGPGPGVLDFQDAVHGPLTYDVVSLLRDCYVAWPREQVEAWLEGVFRRQRAAGLLPAAVPWETWRRWAGRTATQRHLKAAGIFARLWHRDGRPGYLADIPRTLAYVRAEAAADPGLAPLGALLEDLDLERRLAGAAPGLDSASRS
jgi:hypothetical protein